MYLEDKDVFITWMVTPICQPLTHPTHQQKKLDIWSQLNQRFSRQSPAQLSAQSPVFVPGGASPVSRPTSRAGGRLWGNAWQAAGPFSWDDKNLQLP